VDGVVDGALDESPTIIPAVLLSLLELPGDSEVRSPCTCAVSG
jgi:hypothetical protein